MSIASRIQEIETHIGDVYDTINYSYDTTGINKNIINIPKYLKKGYIDIINNGIDTLYNNFPKVSGIGSNLSLTPTYEAPMKLNEIQGDTLQDGTPTPNTPVEIQSVTGNQEIKVTGKNLCNNVALSNSNNDIFFYFDKDISQTFTLSATINSATSGNSIYLTLNGSSLGKIGEITGSANTKQSVTITFTNEIYEQIQNSTTRYLQLYKNNAGFTLPTDAQIENNSTATEYEPYKGNTYEVNLGNIELNKIGDYKDRIYKDNGKWYIEKQIGKVVLDGTENGWSYNDANAVFIIPDLVDYLRDGFIPYSNLLQGQNISAYNQLSANSISFLRSTTQNRIVIKNTNYTGVTAFKNWLNSNNVTVYYVLATPEYTEITNTELIEDLETLYTAKSQEGTTNISITSEDLEMILNVSALKGDA